MSPGEGRRKRLRSSDYACQFLTHDSPVHRLRPYWKIAIGTLLSACAVGARTPAEFLLLLTVVLGYFFAARLTLYDLWRDSRLLVMQGAVVITAYCLLHGRSGLWPGVRTSVQIILFYLPGAVFLHTTRSRDLMEGLSRVVPYRLSFLLFVSLRFVPFFLREMEEIAAAQRLRGARLLPREMLDPRNWKDLYNCLLIPLMVRALKTADEVAKSAEARGFGLEKERTYFDVKAFHEEKSASTLEIQDRPLSLGPGHRCLDQISGKEKYEKF
jgi:energy-coupling factor transporter transmembrane protein EcfT